MRVITTETISGQKNCRRLICASRSKQARSFVFLKKSIALSIRKGRHRGQPLLGTSFFWKGIRSRARRTRWEGGREDTGRTPALLVRPIGTRSLELRMESVLNIQGTVARARGQITGALGRLKKEAPLAHRLAHGSFWALSGTVASRIFSMATTIFLARILGKADYGAYGMVQSTIGMFGLFAGLSMGATTTKYVAQLKTTDPSRAGKILSLTTMLAIVSGGVVMVLLGFTAPWLARTTLNRSDLSPVLMTGALLLFVSTVNGVQTSSLAGFEAFRELARINVLQGITTPLVALPLVYTFGIQGGIMALTIVAVLGWYLCAMALRRECNKFHIVRRIFSRSNFSERGILWSFGLPALISGALVMPVTWATNAILANQANGYSELGLFNAANQWRQLIIFIPQVLAGVMLPIFSDVHGRRNPGEFLHVLNINLGITWAVALPMAILTIVLRNQLSAVFGGQFSHMSLLVVPLMIASFLNILNNVVGTALMGSGKMWTGAIFNMAWALALWIGTLILVPHFGGMGLAVAYLIAYVLHTVWQMAYVEIKLAPSSIRRHWRLAVLSVVCLSAAPFTSRLYLPSVVIDLILTFLGLLPLWGPLSKFMTGTHSATITS